MRRILQTLLFSCLFITAYTQDIEKIATVETNPSGSIIFVRFDKGIRVPVAQAPSVFLRMFQKQDNLSFTKASVESDALGFIHEKYRVVYKNIEVDAGGIITHSRNGYIEHISSTMPNIKNESDATIIVNKENALKKALNAVGAKKYKWELKEAQLFLKKSTNNPGATYDPAGKLFFIKNPRPGQDNFILAYRFIISAYEPEEDLLITIDAKSGTVISKNNFNCHGNTPGTADTRYNGTKAIITDSYSGGYRLRETTRGQGIETYDMNKNTFIYIPQNFTDFTDNDNNWTAAEFNNATFDNVALDAHWGAEMTYDYFMQKHNRNSYDGNGAKIFTYVHFDNNWNNAGWLRRAHAIILGDGNASNNPWASLDIMGHEFGHALNQFTMNGGNEYPIPEGSEEGAIDEGLADIWGACVEKFAATNTTIDPWLIGEQVTLAATCFRSLRNPSVTGNPDTYQGTNYVINNYGTNIGHANGNVIGHWFYLLSEGGTGINDLNTNFCVVGIGIEKAAKIVYRAETYYLGYKAEMLDLPAAVKQAAIDLYGISSNEYYQTVNALIAVNLEPKRAYNLTISGPSSFCTSGIFSVPNMPAGHTLAWTPAINPHLTFNTATSNPTTVTKLNNSWMDFQAVITDPLGCVVYTTPPKSVSFGTPLAFYNVYYYPGPEPTCYSTWAFHTFRANLTWGIGVESVEWGYRITGVPGSEVIYPYDVYAYTFIPYDIGNYEIFIRPKNSCGTGMESIKYVTVSECWGWKQMITTYPNPAHDEIIVTIDTKGRKPTSKISTSTYADIEIIDAATGMPVKKWRLPGNQNTYRLNVSTIKTGVYALRIIDGGNKMSKLIRIEK